MPGITADFARSLSAFAGQAVTPELAHRAQRCLLDYLGVTLAGASLQRSKAEALIEGLSGPEGAMVIGMGRQADLQTAALVNGMNAHVAELDDGVRFGSVHPGAAVISALLPIAERSGWTTAQLLQGIIVGYEAAVRLACAIQPSHRNRGYHATGTCGAVGAAMGIAAGAGFTEHEARQALAAAVLSASGMLRAMEGDSELKAYNAGKAASTGLVAAAMARAGFQAPADVFEGPRGFLRMTSEQFKLEQLLPSDERPMAAIEKVYVKPYAACRHCHPAIEAALRLKDEFAIDVFSIRRIAVRTYALAVGGHEHRDIAGPTAAKMSTPYSVAIALVDGMAGIQQFSEPRIGDPRVLELAAKVEVRLDGELDALVPGKRPAEVEIELADGRTCSARVDLPKGEPETAVDDAGLTAKFLDLVRFSGRSERQARLMADAVWGLESGLDGLWRSLES